MSSNPTRLAFVDHLRGAAVLGVFLFHALTGAEKLFWSGWTRDFADGYKDLFAPLNLGWLGVAVFFVVSGFCIHLSFQNQGRRWKEFFLRRFFRLMPAYVVAVLFFACVLPYSRLDFHADRLAGWNVLSHLLLVHTFDPRTFHGISSSFWTIGIEVQLYLLYPVLVYVSARHGWGRAMWLAGGWELAIRLSGALLPLTFGQPPTATGWGARLELVGAGFSHLESSPLAFWLSWSLGALLAERYLKHEPLPFLNLPLWVPLAAVVSCFVVRALSGFIFLSAALATARLMAGLIERENHQALKAPPWLEPLRQLGSCSYSFYLLHQPLMYALTTNFSHGVLDLEDRPFLHYLVSLTTIVFIFPFSVVVYRFLEQPGIDAGKRLIRRLSSTPCRRPAVV